LDIKQVAQSGEILRIRSGSQLYGLMTPQSDKDFIGIFIPDKKMLYGFCGNKNTTDLSVNNKSVNLKNDSKSIDITLYNIKHFLKLAINNNPNIIELLFAPDSNIMLRNEFGMRLIRNKHLFPNKGLKNSILGTSDGHRHKMSLSEDFNNKSASHAVRLLFEGIELLETGNLEFPLKQREILLDIKLGKYDKDWIIEKLANLRLQLIDAHEKSKLPEKNENYDKVEKLCIDIIDSYIKVKYQYE